MFCRKDKNMMYDALYGRQSIEKKTVYPLKASLNIAGMKPTATLISNMPTEVLVGRIPTDRTLKG